MCVLPARRGRMMRVARAAGEGSRRRVAVVCVSQIADFNFSDGCLPPHADATRADQGRKAARKSVAGQRLCVPSFGFLVVKKTGNAHKWQPASSLPARQKVQFVTRECVIILLTRLRRPDCDRDLGKYCFISPKDGISPNSHPLLCCLLH